MSFLDLSAEELAALIEDRAHHLAEMSHPNPKRAAYLIGVWAKRMEELLPHDGYA